MLEGSGPAFCRDLVMQTSQAFGEPRPEENTAETRRTQRRDRSQMANGKWQMLLSQSLLPETDFADTIVKVFSAAQDFDFHAHEIDRQVTPIYLGKAHRILLCCDDGFGEFFLAAIDDLDHLELGKPMMVRKT